MTRKVLKQEPCKDAISRRAVLDTLNKMDSVLDEDRTVENYKALLKECYKDLPSSVTSARKREWIPCSVKMPKPNEFVDNVYKYYLIQDEHGYMYTARYTDNGWIPIASPYILNTNIVAWRPLPEPYNAESEE